MIVMMLFMGACAPKQFVPFQPPELTIENTAPYVLDMTTISKPEKLIPIYVDENMKPTTIDKAKFVLLAPSEYAKIGALVKLAETYKMIAIEEASFVNIHIDTINSLKEYVALERQKAIEYRNLWMMSENAYRQEEYRHKMDNRINKATMYLITIGSIVLLAVGL
jgi:hypothetical protein